MNLKYFYLVIVLVCSFFITCFLIYDINEENSMWGDNFNFLLHIALLYGHMGTTVIVVIDIIRFYYWV